MRKDGDDDGGDAVRRRLVKWKNEKIKQEGRG